MSERRSPAAVWAAIVLSGAAGLIYEVCWIRRASLVFGSTLFAVSTVLAVFFLGLALGSEWLGRVSARTARPLRLYAALEAGLAAFALASLPAFALADRIYGAAFRAGAGTAPLAGLRVALVAAVLLPPTFAMGGTLPLVCRVLVGRGVVRGVGAVYALNTLGAAIGAAAAGFVLLPALGLTAAIGVGAALNLAAAAFARLAGAAPVSSEDAAPRRGQTVAGDRAMEESERTDAGEGATAGRGQWAGGATTVARDLTAKPRLGGARLGVLVFLTGFAALGYEVLWTRFLGLVVRNTIHTYTLTLVVVLLGIVTGSALAARLGERPGSRLAVFGALQIGIALAVRAVMSLPPAVWGGIASEVAVVALLMLPAAVLSGMTFPLAVKLFTVEGEPASPAVGRVFALNTLGGIAGSLVTGFLLVPRLGTGPAVWALTAASLATGWLALLPAGAAATPAPVASDRARIAPRVTLAIAGLALWLAFPALWRTRVPEDFLTEGGALIEAREGMMSYLAVVQIPGGRALYIDRWWQGQSTRTRQLVAAHVPALLHPHPRSVLVVGVGVGQTAGRFLLYDIERLDCVDIEPRLFDLLPRHFDTAWMRDPRVHAIRADGRNVIHHAADRYDVISLEVGQLFRPGAAAFYTREFYRDARARLLPGGIVSQFLPLAMLSPAMLRDVVATFRDVFPNSLLWYNNAEMLLIGSTADGLRVDRERIGRLTAAGPIHGDLDYWYWGSPANALRRPEVLLAGLLCDSLGLSRLARGGAVQRDDRPALEEQAGRVTLDETNELAAIPMIAANLAPAGAGIEPPFPPDSLRSIERLRRRNLDCLYAAAFERRLRRLATVDLRVAALDSALRLQPGNGELHRLMGVELARSGRSETAGSHFDAAAAIGFDDAIAQRSLGLWRMDAGDAASAALALGRAVDLDPERAEARNDLGAALATLGRWSEARDEFAAALRLAPRDTLAQANLARIDAEIARRRGRGQLSQ